MIVCRIPIAAMKTDIHRRSPAYAYSKGFAFGACLKIASSKNIYPLPQLDYE